MLSKRHLPIAIVVVLIVGISVFVYLVRSRRPPAPPSMRADQPAPVDPGTPVQRARIDDYIARVGQEDFDTLVKNLNQHEDLLVAVGNWAQGAAPRNMFAVCLANRRLAKIFVQLEGQPPAKADRQCRAIFQQKFDLLKSDILELVPSWKQGTTPQRPRPIDEDYVALHSAVFLSAAFCPVAEVLRQLGEWEEFYRSLEPSGEGLPDERTATLARAALEHSVPPEDVFLLNVYLWMLRDRCGDRGFESLLPKKLPTETIAFCAWNAHTNPFDFTHIHRGEAVDDQRVLRELTFHRGWDVWPASFQERNRKVLDSLRQRVQECVAREASHDENGG